MTNVENMVLRTVYVDPDVDDQLRTQAVDRGLSKAELFRRYLAAGMKVARTRPDLFRAIQPDSGPPLILRTVYMNPKLDDKLRVEAFDSRTSKNDLMRRYVRLGMSGAPQASAP
jgi:hypothetical protein